MIRAAIFLTLATAAPAQRLSTLGSDGPGGVSVWHIDHWDWMGVHVDPAPAPTVTPEPQSPVVMLAAAGAALILRRNGGAK
jgi:hypothetical protein